MAAVLRALPIFTLSFMCHFNAIGMHAELVSCSHDRRACVRCLSCASSRFFSVSFRLTQQGRGSRWSLQSPYLLLPSFMQLLV